MSTVSFRMIPSAWCVNCKSTESTSIGFPTWQTLSGNGPCPAGRQAPPELHQDHFWKKKVTRPWKIDILNPKMDATGWWLSFSIGVIILASILIFRGVSSHKRSNSGRKTTKSIQKPSHILDFWQLCLQVIQNTAPIFFVFNPSFTHIFAPQIRLVRCLCCQLMQTLEILTKKPLKKEIQVVLRRKNEWIWIQICWVCVFLGTPSQWSIPKKWLSQPSMIIPHQLNMEWIKKELPGKETSWY